MAWIETDAAGNKSIAFRVDGRKFKRSLNTKDRRSAELARGKVEENLAFVNRGRLTVPPRCALVSFLLSDGRCGAGSSSRDS